MNKPKQCWRNSEKTKKKIRKFMIYLSVNQFTTGNYIIMDVN